MIGIIVAAHGPLPAALIESAEMIGGKQPQLESVSLIAGRSPRELADMLKEAIKKVNSEEGVLVLVDIPGGSPCNAVAQLLSEGYDLQAVSGVSLPMLLEVLAARWGEEDTALLADAAVQLGIDGIINISKSLLEED